MAKSKPKSDAKPAPKKPAAKFAKKKPSAKPKPKVSAAAPPKKPPRKPPAPPASPTPPDPSESYDKFLSRQAAAARKISSSGRDIDNPAPGFPKGYGDLEVADPDRRESCQHSLRLFCETYNPAAFSMGWSDDHLRAIARIEEAAKLGALYAFAEPRGNGKTTRTRMAALWVLSYAHRRYPFLINATDDKARETLDTLRILIRFLPEYAADFPEISYPAMRLQGIANRASGQTCRGQSTLIEWAADRVVLPTMPPPKKWQNHWPLRADGMVPTSGVLVSASGLTGEGIRGSLKTLTTGEMVRPDFVLIDDPQTPESARSRTQNDTRLKLISADILGMAGPGKSIAAVMPCTVIERGDMVDEILDREKHPLWRGERTAMLRSMPKNLDEWDRYFEVFARCAQLEPPDFTESNALYVARRAVLDEGGVASWPARKQDWEVSALQSAMHLYFRDPRAFMAEYQNRPLDPNPETSAGLDADEVAAKVTNVPRFVVPRECTRLTAFIDVGAHLLWWAVVAWDERFGGSVIAYGSYPEQPRSYFVASEARHTLGSVPGMERQSEDAAIWAGLTAVVNSVVGRAYTQEETGADLRVDRCLIDANWGEKTELVYNFCRRCEPFVSRVYPSHGKYIGASGSPMGSWPRKPTDIQRRGNWILSAGGSLRGRHVTFDTNNWKSFVAERFRTPPGAAGCLSLHKPGVDRHQLIADHLTAEYPIAVTRQAGGRTVDEWKNKPNRDNHLWDCCVGAAVAAGVAGLVWDGGAAAGAPDDQPRRRRLTLSEKMALRGAPRVIGDGPGGAE